MVKYRPTTGVWRRLVLGLLLLESLLARRFGDSVVDILLEALQGFVQGQVFNILGDVIQAAEQVHRIDPD